jgi:hypothetical protein
MENRAGGLAAMTETCIPQMIGSKIGQHSGYCDGGSIALLSSLQA